MLFYHKDLFHQPSLLSFKQLSIKEGLPTSIISLYDDKNGSLWVGTTQGIYRFNGEKSRNIIYRIYYVKQPLHQRYFRR